MSTVRSRHFAIDKVGELHAANRSTFVVAHYVGGFCYIRLGNGLIRSVGLSMVVLIVI